MYGKIFSRMYEGSMVGAGSIVFAVWGYCISKADPEAHTVDLNPILLSAIIGDTEERIQHAIEFLSNPDPKSHNPEHEGRRLLHTTGMEYFLVSHEEYRKITNNDDLRSYFREMKRKQRVSKNVLDNLGQSQDSASASASASVSAFSSEDKSPERRNVDFAVFYKAYPKKKKPKDAFKAWSQTAKERPELEVLLKAIERQQQSRAWGKDGGQFIPYPATWLRSGSWADEVMINEGDTLGTGGL